MNDLSDELASRHGIPRGWWFGKRFSVRWGELDGFGHVNHVADLVWCEETRNAFLASLGHPLAGPETPGPVIKRVSFVYERPLRHGDEVVVTARAKWVRRTSFRMDYAAWSHGLAGFGHAVCVWFLNAAGRSVEIPEDLRRSFIERDGCRDLRGSRPGPDRAAT